MLLAPLDVRVVLYRPPGQRHGGLDQGLPLWQVRAVGAIEILGACGLILPPLTGIVPVLAVVAAAGFVLLQVLATRLHVSRGEGRQTGLNLALIAAAGVAAWLATAW